MHTYKADGGTVFNYNSDFSGDVRISEKGSEHIIAVKGEDLIDFIAYCFVVPKRIAALEDASSESALLLG